MAEIFRRVEKKYIIDKKQFDKLTTKLKEYMEEDQHGKSTICNLYFDTEQFDLIRHSITKPYFKEKIRLRSYNTPNDNSTVFLEIKRKCNKIVSKRRIEMKLKEYKQYIKNIKEIKNTNIQIKKELDYCFNIYNLKPTMYLCYDRIAYYQKDNMDFRITFDNNVLARTKDLNLDSGNYGNKILNPNYYIMEIKTLGSIPLWFVRLINEIEIKPGNFSKYGEAYEQIIMKKDINKVVRCIQKTNEKIDYKKEILYAI